MVGLRFLFFSCNADLEVCAFDAFDLEVISVVCDHGFGSKCTLEAMFLIDGPANFANRVIELGANLLDAFVKLQVI